ncbi:putative unc-13 (munc13) [Schistosoma mansoni]|uniref:putative unc-13 (munc13) n=1 Tax=Schistosoma mansoni TaxID=6183 RepID=UPI00022DC06D|nr:putative unc-13 (munc13) [Schistosoma mansoni]|eukprot:XP_018653639.1 putative unc-13 (munc13) [Schistosoma mansoni]
MSNYPVYHPILPNQSEWDPASEVERIMCGTRQQEYPVITSGSHTLPRHYQLRETNLITFRYRAMNGGECSTINRYDKNIQHANKMYPWGSPTTSVRQFTTTFHPSYQTSVGYDPSALFSSSPSSVRSDEQLYYRQQRLVKPVNQSRYVLSTNNTFSTAITTNSTTTTTVAYPHNRNTMNNHIMYNTLQLTGHVNQLPVQQTPINHLNNTTRLQYPSALVRTIVRMESSGSQQPQQQQQQQPADIPPALPLRAQRSTNQKVTVPTKPRHLIPIPLEDRVHLDPNMVLYKPNAGINNHNNFDDNLSQSISVQLNHKRNTFDLESHLDCSCDYVRGEAGLWPADVWFERNFHTVDKCTCPHEEVHRFFDNAPSKWKLADTIAMLPIRETDILDDLIDSTSDEDESFHRSLPSVMMESPADTISKIKIVTTNYNDLNVTSTPLLNIPMSSNLNHVQSDVQKDKSTYKTSITCHNLVTNNTSSNISCDEDDLVPLGELLSSNTNLLRTISNLDKPEFSVGETTVRLTPASSRKQSLLCLKEDEDERNTSISRRNSSQFMEQREHIPGVTKGVVSTVAISSVPNDTHCLDVIATNTSRRKSPPGETSSQLWKAQIAEREDNIPKNRAKSIYRQSGDGHLTGKSYINTEGTHTEDVLILNNLTDPGRNDMERSIQDMIGENKTEQQKEERKQSLSPSVNRFLEPDGCVYTENKENAFQIDNVAEALDRLHQDMRSAIESKLVDNSSSSTMNKEGSLTICPKMESCSNLLDRQNKHLYTKYDWRDENREFSQNKENHLIHDIELMGEDNNTEHDQEIDVDHYFLQPRRSTLKLDDNDLSVIRYPVSHKSTGNNYIGHVPSDNREFNDKTQNVIDNDEENDVGVHYYEDDRNSMVEENEELNQSMEYKFNDELTDPSLSKKSGQTIRVNKYGRAKERWSLLRTHVGKVGRQKAEDSDSTSAFGFYRSIESQPEQQPWAKKAIPMVGDLTMAQKRTLTSLSSNLASWTLTDQELKMHVYRKTLQALAYPISSNTPHNFQLFSATSPTYCYECEGLLWGVARQGLRCTECGVKCHDKCKRLLNADCLQRAAEKSLRHGAVDKAQAAMEAIRALIQRRITERSDIFEFLANVFQIDVHSMTHLNALEFAQKSIVAGASQWSAKIAITVKSAQGLIGKDKTGRSDPYVTVQVGKVRKRTKTVLQELNPTWDEKFLFECDNALERIKLRVWDEDNDLKSKIRQKFTRESDDFLGQTIIEVRTLSGEMDVWYNLEKRTDKSAVSGAIRLLISVEIKGEEQMASFHVQYTALHGGNEAWRVYFNPIGQEIVDEFAIRYGIEPIFQAMTHFACLTAKYNYPGVPAQLSVLLANINAFYAHTTSSNSQTASERFSASNFGREKFIKLLDNLYIAIRIDLSKYRTVFPASQPERLIDLKSTVDLLTSITFFRLKVQELSSPPRTGQILRECIEACIHATYQCLCENVHDLYGKKSGNAEFVSDNMNSGTGQSLIGELDQVDGIRSLTYWHRLITLVVSVLEDDRKHYAPVLNQFPHEINLGDMSAEMIWKCLSEDLANGLVQHTITAKYYFNNTEEDILDSLSKVNKLHDSSQSTGQNKVVLKSGMNKIKSSDYMNLCFRVKWFYNTYIATLARFKNSVPDYPRWFEGLVLIWLAENDEVSANYLRNAYDRDKQDGFQCSSEHVLYSNSVVDVFTQLNQCFDVIRKLECPDKQVEGHFFHRFSLTVEKVLLAYADRVLADFPTYKTDQRVACILVNNTQQLRVQLEKVYENMARESLESNTRDRLSALQGRLNEVVDKLAIQLTDQFEAGVRSHARECGKLLQKCRPSNSSDNTTGRGVSKEDEANECLQPLMDHFESILSILANVCDKTVLKRILKQLWRITMCNLEKLVVLPTVTDQKQETTREPEKGLTPYQCELLGICLNNNSCIFSCWWTWCETFEPVGYLTLQVEIFKHPGTGEYKVNVKIHTASDLNWSLATGMFRPFVEVYIFGPLLSDRKRKAATKSKSVTTMPIYHETFVFFLSNQSDPEWYELHLSVKDYCFGRTDRLVGVTVLSLSRALNLGATPIRLPLGRRLHFTETGWTVLRVLSQRVNTDDVAREFVRAKSEYRAPTENDNTGLLTQQNGE